MEVEDAVAGANAMEVEDAVAGANAMEVEDAGAIAMAWSLSTTQSRNVMRHSSMVLTSGAAGAGAGARAGALDFMYSWKS
jgi:hypothetical protein